MKYLIYTFPSFPAIAELQELDPHTFVFHKPKADLVEFIKLIEITKPTSILGIAKASGKTSYREALAINSFHGGKVDKLGKDAYELNLSPEFAGLGRIRHVGSNTFCNYVMYKLSQHLEDQTVSHSFVHIAKADWPEVRKRLQTFQFAHKPTNL